MASVSEEQWREKVRRELKGKPWNKAFVKKTSDNIPIKPLYTKLDRPTECVPIIQRQTTWQRIFEIQNEHTNADLMAVLQLGIDAVWVRFSKTYPNGTYKGCANRELSHWEKLFSGVEIHMLKVYVVLGDHPTQERNIFSQLESNSSSVIFVEDCISSEILGTQVETSTNGFLSSTRLAQLAGASPINELVLHLRLWASLCRRSTTSPEEIASLIQIELPADANIFETVAKHRALHLLWSGFWNCFEVAAKPVILSVTSPRMLSDLDEYTNILRSTHASTAAIFGGCVGLNILPFDYRLESTSREAVRISALLHGILAEEAHLGAIQDPFAGSYYVENLTEQMAEAAWQAFRLWSGQEDGSVVDAEILKSLRQNQIRRVAEISHRHRPLTAISEFPELGVRHQPRRTRWTSENHEFQFDSDVFTDVRRAVEARSDSLVVQIICIGQEADWTPRYHFALNAFAVGGLQHKHTSVANLDEFEKILEALAPEEIVCLCAPDSIYEDLGGQTKINNQNLYLAGAPKHALKVKATPIYKGCNLQAVLAEMTDQRSM